MQLSNRLEALAGFIDKGDKVADIGTDHGFVPNFIVEKGISDFCIASDISENSLKKSIELTRELKNEDKIVNRTGPGLSILRKNEVDDVIIAGMGGLLISEILEDDFEVVKNLKKLILQPMQAQKELRKYLYEKGYEITDEKIIFEDRKYFEIIVAKYTGIKKNIDKIYYEIPYMPYIRRDSVIKDYLTNRIEYSTMILDNLNKSSEKKKVEKKIKELEEFISKCGVLLSEIQS